MGYSLTRTKDNDYLDQHGITWSSPEMWFFIDILGGCGCGSSDELATKAVGLLNQFAKDYRDFDHDDLVLEVIAHWFDSKGITEHGTVITGSWLTDKGKDIHAVLNGNLS